MGEVSIADLLIAPVWNWNTITVGASWGLIAFNRTSLELKRLVAGVRAWYAQGLLIAPVWNWNWHNCYFPKGGSAFNRTSLELKRCRTQSPWISSHNTFNRTSLELKRATWCPIAANNDLLIAPVWNWNHQSEGCRGGSIGLLIAPVWNWNVCRMYSAVIWRPFNRTSLELKHKG